MLEVAFHVRKRNKESTDVIIIESSVSAKKIGLSAKKIGLIAKLGV